jgi:APA family basic amino acid/polyamine antiporter
MLGTGVFAAWTPALRWSGPYLLASLAIAGVVAALNAWSTARLAAHLPAAGGAYAYGRELLGRPAGVIAGAAFVVGKIASAGAAALTVGAYVWPDAARPLGLVAVLIMLALDLRGVTRTAVAAAVGSAFVIVVLLLLSVVAGSMTRTPGVIEPQHPGVLDVLAGAGLLFVAFAGYARVATLGEEVREPRRTIPRAIAMAFLVVGIVYVVVAVAVLHVVAPLPIDARGAAPLFGMADGALNLLVRVAAVVAAGGALLSLLAGVGRTLFAMARGGDGPASLAGVSRHGVPARAEVVAAVGASVVVVIGGIGVALALSGVSILLYYGVAHLAALRLPASERPPLVVPLLGLLGCAVVGGAVLLVGLHVVAPGA